MLIPITLPVVTEIFLFGETGRGCSFPMDAPIKVLRNFWIFPILTINSPFHIPLERRRLTPAPTSTPVAFGTKLFLLKCTVTAERARWLKIYEQFSFSARRFR